MPIIAAITGGIDFSNMYFMLTGAAPEGAGLATRARSGSVFAYGNFLTIASTS